MILAIAAALVFRSMTAPIPVEPVSVSMAYPSQSFALLNATGYVVAQRKAAVASKATGRLEWLGVREGSRVKEGEVLARLESRDVTATKEQAAANIKLAQANLEQGQAELNEAERNFNRSRDLLAKNFVSQAAHDAAISRFEKAKSAIAGYRASIAVAQANFRATEVGVEQTLIRAPFEGVVLTKNANVGDVITPFSSALGFAGARSSRWRTCRRWRSRRTCRNPTSKRSSPTSRAKLQLDALPGVRFRGRLLRMVPTVDRAKATVMAKIRFTELDPRILPEMSAKVSFLSQEMPEGERTARTVLQPAPIVQRDGKSVVFVIKGDKVAPGGNRDRGQDRRDGGDQVGRGRRRPRRHAALGKTARWRADCAVGKMKRRAPRHYAWARARQQRRASMSEPVVEIKNLVKSYRRGGQVVPVLTNITFDIAAGDYVALMGPSGSGKSTLLNLIAGHRQARQRHDLRVGGIDITALGEAELAALACRQRGLHFPVLQPDAGADGVRERRAAAAADRAVGARARRARD